MVGWKCSVGKGNKSQETVIFHCLLFFGSFTFLGFGESFWVKKNLMVADVWVMN